MLVVANVLSFVDRQILGLPLGRYAERANRRNLIIAGITIWSIMTMTCDLAHSYG